jgi:D-erythrulose 1-phosphate 3-epimerase
MSNIAPDGYRLGINTGFAVNRYSEPEEWIRIVGDELGLNIVQFTADMLNVDLPMDIVSKQVNRIQKACQLYNVEITSTFTGAFTRVNHLAHPDPDIRRHWVDWFKRFVDLSVDLGSKSMGSHFGIFTHLDNNNPESRSVRRQQNIDGWHEIANYAKDKGLDFISWEPMSISREQGETIAEAHRLQRDVNINSPLPFKICLDVDHGDLSSSDPRDTNPYEWLDEFIVESPLVHLKQTNVNKPGHWPFTETYNKVGRIQPNEFVNKLVDKGVHKVDLFLEPAFKEREPSDSTVVEVLKESVEFWRQVVKN